jgi:hypothetical protein
MDDRPLEEWEFPEPDEDEDEDVAETQPCPSCGAAIYEDAEQCPVCGDYVVESRRTLSGWPWWFVALGLLAIVAVILALIWGT